MIYFLKACNCIFEVYKAGRVRALSGYVGDAQDDQKKYMIQCMNMHILMPTKRDKAYKQGR